MIRSFITWSVIIVVGFGVLTYFFPQSWWVFIIIIPLLALGIRDLLQNNHSVLRNFPVVGHFRYLFEKIRPEINQYFVESDIDGRPFNRISRSIIYQRAKGVLDKEPFGTKLDYNEPGYDWFLHSAHPIAEIEEDLKVKVGGADCIQPYKASILNISAMSYGALSANAVQAMNGGAQIDGFAQNTGEGGISDHHLKFGGDLIWQIGTGYFGCRDENGGFDENLFSQKAQKPEVKMVELKLSQGAKPGEGGILPAKKNSEEIAKTRHVTPHEAVLSPPSHQVFDTPTGLMNFIQKLRELSGGKPVGFKLCIGLKHEFLSICKAMQETGIKPDFITIDGAEGGTGAAPLEFSNWVGMPLVEGLTFAYNALHGFDLKKDIRLFAAGKVVTAYDLVRLLCLGADACYSARAMMMATGCIQALRCHNNTCPVGVTTHDPQLTRGLVVSDKKHRVANYHKDTIKSVKELLASAGISSLAELDRTLIERRVDTHSVKRLDQLFPYIKQKSLLKPPFPEDFHEDMMSSTPHNFRQNKEPVYKA